MYPEIKDIFGNNCFEIQWYINQIALFVVNTDSQHRLESGIYKSKIQINKHLKICFGDISNWQKIKADNILFDKELEIL